VTFAVSRLLTRHHDISLPIALSRPTRCANRTDECGDPLHSWHRRQWRSAPTEPAGTWAAIRIDTPTMSTSAGNDRRLPGRNRTCAIGRTKSLQRVPPTTFPPSKRRGIARCKGHRDGPTVTECRRVCSAWLTPSGYEGRASGTRCRYRHATVTPTDRAGTWKLDARRVTRARASNPLVAGRRRVTSGSSSRCAGAIPAQSK
jgi:hypothetical protein